jgi:hypothetical protein
MAVANIIVDVVIVMVAVGVVMVRHGGRNERWRIL